MFRWLEGPTNTLEIIPEAVGQCPAAVDRLLGALGLPLDPLSQFLSCQLVALEIHGSLRPNCSSVAVSSAMRAATTSANSSSLIIEPVSPHVGARQLVRLSTLLAYPPRSWKPRPLPTPDVDLCLGASHRGSGLGRYVADRLHLHQQVSRHHRTAKVEVDLPSTGAVRGDEAPVAPHAEKFSAPFHRQRRCGRE